MIFLERYKKHLAINNELKKFNVNKIKLAQIAFVKNSFPNKIIYKNMKAKI